MLGLMPVPVFPRRSKNIFRAAESQPGVPPGEPAMLRDLVE